MSGPEELRESMQRLANKRIAEAGLTEGSAPVAVQAALDRIASEINEEMAERELLPPIYMKLVADHEVEVGFRDETP